MSTIAPASAIKDGKYQVRLNGDSTYLAELRNGKWFLRDDTGWEEPVLEGEQVEIIRSTLGLPYLNIPMRVKMLKIELDKGYLDDDEVSIHFKRDGKDVFLHAVDCHRMWDKRGCTIEAVEEE